MEKLTEFVSKSFDPSKSALSVQYLAQSAARPDPLRSETPGGTESDSSGPHDLRVTVPHPALSLGLPLDLPRYPTVPITSAGLPYPLPLLMAHRPPTQLHHIPLRQHPLSPRSPSPASPCHLDAPSPKRRRRLSEDDRRSPFSQDDEEDVEVDVEAPDHPDESSGLTATSPAHSQDQDKDARAALSSPTLSSDQDTIVHEDKDKIPIKSEPTDSLSNDNASVSSSQDIINNNSNHSTSSSIAKPDKDTGTKSLLAPTSPGAVHGCVSHLSDVSHTVAGGNYSSRIPPKDPAQLRRTPEGSDGERHTPGEASFVCSPCTSFRRRMN